MHRFVTLMVVLSLGLLTAACVAPVPTSPDFKPLIVGVIDKGNAAPFLAGQAFPVADLSLDASRSPGLGGTVVNVSWSQLEPTPGRYDFSTLDASLAAVSAYDMTHPDTALAVKLRVFGANGAPVWAKTLAGTPITITANGSIRGTVGQWWKPDYRAAWAGLQAVLAYRYDNNPLVHEVAVSSCSSLTAEPFVMSPAPSNVAQLLADGWTNSAQQACLDGAFADYAPWRGLAYSFYAWRPDTPET